MRICIIFAIKILNISTSKKISVHIDEGLTFEEHICTKVRIANALVDGIGRGFTFLDGHTLKKLYSSMVRPHVEYGQSIWSPFLLKYINMIERLQERATKLVDGYGKLDYCERLKKAWSHYTSLSATPRRSN